MPSTAWRTPKTRRTREEVQPFMDLLEAQMPSGNYTWYAGGSWARHAPTIGDLDIAVVLPAPDTFEGFAFPEAFTAQRSGPEIAQGDLTLPTGESIHVDFWCIRPRMAAAFRMFITGPVDLNVAQRGHAKAMGLSLSQIGLMVADAELYYRSTSTGFPMPRRHPDTGNQFTDGEQIDLVGTEPDIYDILGLQWLEPEERQAFVKPSTEDVIEYEALSRSNPEAVPHKVQQRGTFFTCDCKGYSYSTASPRRCRHTDDAREGKLGPGRVVK